MSSIIEIRGLGKKYKLAEAQQYLALRDVISNAGKQLFSKKPAYRTGREKEKEFWALQDINLDIETGDRVGIIGRNGAGKSTLLKILSKITPPTTGNIKLHGRVASLLEVGTGFHPELTGRENIYLNGSILGLKKAEINRRLNEIIDFSGVEKFIDTPIKHYSSGMQLRLAFSVAAHLEPEILLIDEVLAVGDMEFQKKCLGKMEEVSKQEGRTILFVSHNLAQLKQLCNTAVLLDKGRMAGYGKVNEILKKYNEEIFSGHNTHYKKSCAIEENRLLEVSILKNNQPVSDAVFPGDEIYVDTVVNAAEVVTNSLIAIRFTNQENIPVFTTTNGDADLSYPSISKGTSRFRVKIPSAFFTPGRYSLIVSWSVPGKQAFDVISNEVFLEVENDRYPGIILNDQRMETFHQSLIWEKT
jgi:lipopolysaccharide transport system ATP-binding protein